MLKNIFPICILLSLQIATYPRTISGSVRATDAKRKTKRKEREARKEKVGTKFQPGISILHM